MCIPLFALGISLCLTPLAITQHKDSFPDTPSNHWAYQAMADLHSVGLTYGFPPFIGRGYRPTSRYEAAVAVYAASTDLGGMVTDVDRINKFVAHFAGQEQDEAPERVESDTSIQHKVKSVQHLQAVLEKDLEGLLNEFSPELKSLGADPVEMEGQIRRDFRKIATVRWAKLGEATKQFSDVPENHWAAGATKALRSSGILVGYGDGSFHPAREH